MTVVPTRLRPPSVSARVGRRHGVQASQWVWLGGGALFAFLVPFVFADVIGVSRDLYYAIYSTSVFVFFAAWVRASGLNVREFFARNWKWSVALGLLAGAVLAVVVLKDAGSAHPHGATFAAEIAWRGVVYGAADGILLGSFPVLAVVAAIPYRRGRAHCAPHARDRHAALAMAFGFTAAYHAGYSEFRSGKLATPVRGTGDLWSAPTLLTLNPLGAPIAHIAVHVSAVIHDLLDRHVPAAGTDPFCGVSTCVRVGFSSRCGRQVGWRRRRGRRTRGERDEPVDVGGVGREAERGADGAAGGQADRADVVVERHPVAELAADERLAGDREGDLAGAGVAEAAGAQRDLVACARRGRRSARRRRGRRGGGS